MDEVTESLASDERREGSQLSSNTMEDTHKKAIIASDLIKKVISKKIQLEQERKMERGEISEVSSYFERQEIDRHRGKGGRELHRKSSSTSESSSDLAIKCIDNLRDSCSCDTKDDSCRVETVSPAPETDLESACEAGNDTKTGALKESGGTLLRGQNSAFRCWRDEELKFQQVHQNDQSLGDKPPSTRVRDREGDKKSSCGGKLSKMSHLFVPSIQAPSRDREVCQLFHNRNYSPGRNERELRPPSDNTLYIADSRYMARSKSSEMRMNLRSVRKDQMEPLDVSELRAPSFMCDAASLNSTADFKCQALVATLKGESSVKVPHFTVRDIRESKAKLQTPIYQVRDVRKLVKSSYHSVSLASLSEQSKLISHGNPNSVSPIVIKCQSIDTNRNVNQFGILAEVSHQELFDIDGSSPDGTKSAPLQQAVGRQPMWNSSNFSKGDIRLTTTSRSTPMGQEKISEMTDKKPESKMAYQGALEKIQAAVKKMDQLYVFEKNEWKRKTEPQALTDSHVLSLIAREKHGRSEEDGTRGFNMDKTPSASAASPCIDTILKKEDKLCHTDGSCDDTLGMRPMQTTFSPSGNRNMFSLSLNLKDPKATKTPKPNALTQAPYSTKTLIPKSSKPTSLKTAQTKPSGSDGAQPKETENPMQESLSTFADSENYLTIPVKSQTSNNNQASSLDGLSVSTFTVQTQPTTLSGPMQYSSRGQEDPNGFPECFSVSMEARSPEIPSVNIYQSLPLSAATNQPQLYCFSPAIPPAPILDPFQATQMKMLMDPSTGNYYLVDTPVQPATKRLFDPETGQYVDVPLPQPPTTPVPITISPLAFSPGAYGQTYMIYPGFMPTSSAIPPGKQVKSQISVQSEIESAEKALYQQGDGMGMDSPFYMATGQSPKAASGAQQHTTTNRPPQGFSSVQQPIISVSSQQSPMIVGPPSFDRTTMSFVVEHR